MRTMPLLSLLTCLLASSCHASGDAAPPEIRKAVDKTVRPLMQKYNIPGMAVAVTIHGKSYFLNYGVASRATRQPVTKETLFEIGSFSKTFAATLASDAHVNGSLSLSDNAGKYFPSLHGSSCDGVRLLHLGTHTSGLPLSAPDSVENTGQLMDYLKRWRPAQAVGTHRIYSNMGIGLLGLIAAKSLHGSYEGLIGQKLFPKLGMTHSYITVPAGMMRDYAQGYTTKDAPIRLKNAVLASEAYGVKSCTRDLIRFIRANMGTTRLDRKWQRAITDTHTGYFKLGGMTQDLVWEQYPFPVGLKRLLEGNALGSQDVPATPLTPPLRPQDDVWINKTGSTNGFAAYAAFIPAQKTGVVILANKSYPIPPRVTAAYRILTHLHEHVVRG